MVALNFMQPLVLKWVTKCAGWLQRVISWVDSEVRDVVFEFFIFPKQEAIARFDLFLVNHSGDVGRLCIISTRDLWSQGKESVQRSPLTDNKRREPVYWKPQQAPRTTSSNTLIRLSAHSRKPVAVPTIDQS